MKTRLDIINRDNIHFGERYREDYGDVSDLAADIRERGLIQPLAVMEPMEGDDKYRLLAGGRRYQATEEAGLDQIPVNIYPNTISELEIRGIELSENLCRKDLEWTEQIKLQQEIHRLYQSIHGTKTSSSKVVQGEGWGERDTANLLNRSQGAVHQDLQLAQALDATPEMFSDCKNKHDASKVLKSVRENMIKDELRNRATAQSGDSTYQHSQLANSFIVGDFLKQVQQVPTGSINLVEFDPPYSIGLSEIKKQNEVVKDEKLRRYNEIKKQEYRPWIERALKECYRVMSEHSWLILWLAPEPWFETMYQTLIKVGFDTTRIVGIWTKGGSGQNHHPDLYLTNSYEMFMYARKGRPAISKRGRSNEFNFSPVPPQKKYHPTERPIELMMELLSTFGDEGDRVMVPCLGSGVTLIAAYQLGMTAFGYELCEDCKGDFLLSLEQ